MQNSNVWIGLTLLSLVGISALAFVMIDKWEQWNQCEQGMPTVVEMNQKVESLVSDILELEVMMEDMAMSLEIKQQLLEEKNISLGYYQYQAQQLASNQEEENEEVRHLKQQLTAARKQLQEASYTLENQRQASGLVYRIQIGVVNEALIPPLPFTPSDFSVELENEQQKYVLGSFRAYEEALEFRDAIRKVGLDDAWVVPYVNGSRVDNQSTQVYLANQGVSM